MKGIDVQYGIFQDWNANKGNVKAQFILAMFRAATLVRSNKILIILFFLYLIFYRFFVEWVLNIELPWSLKAGSGLRLEHGHALVINGESRLGKNVILRHSTTIGNKRLQNSTYSDCPRIGDNVDIGVHVCIIGPIEIGDNVTIGAGSIVTKNIPSNCVVVGNPARIIKQTDY
jgi:putative colanic acid biosynthesis acetyltransferase WcaB